MNQVKNLRQLATIIVEARDVDYTLRVLRFQCAWGIIVGGGSVCGLLLLFALLADR